MTDWDQSHNRRFGRSDEGSDWRDGRDWRDAAEAGRPDRRPLPARDLGGSDAPLTPSRNPRDDRMQPAARRAPEDRSSTYEQEASPYQPGGGAARGYGDGGDNAYGQMSRGSSDSGLGGYSGADVGGWGQPNLNSQWGQGGYAPLNQGLDYGQDGGRFGPAGYDTGDFAQHRAPAARPSQTQHHDEHHVHYRSWRDAQLANHDRDYSRWREEQARRYDEDYGSWRQERHATFSKEFEGWRTGRGGQAGPGAAAPASGDLTRDAAAASSTSSAEGFAHGANPTLAKIADGHEGHTHARHEETRAEDRRSDTKP